MRESYTRFHRQNPYVVHSRNDSLGILLDELEKKEDVVDEAVFCRLAREVQVEDEQDNSALNQRGKAYKGKKLVTGVGGGKLKLGGRGFKLKKKGPTAAQKERMKAKMGFLIGDEKIKPQVPRVVARLDIKGPNVVKGIRM